MNPKTKNLDGVRFGELVVQSFYEYRLDRNSSKKRGYYLCKCDCGVDKIILGNSLESGKITTCGNKTRHLGDYPKDDLSGSVIGNLKVLEFVKYISYSCPSTCKRWPIYKCECKCGNIVELPRLYIKKYGSCGCGKIDHYKQVIIDNNNKHGKSGIDLCWCRYYNTYVVGAKRRDIIFEISLDDFKELCSKNCIYCGIVPNQDPINRKNGDKILVNGIDRLDNNEPYTKNNCVTCCKNCNFSKHKSSIDDWNIWIDRISDFKNFKFNG